MANVLIVDDDPEDQRQLKTLVERYAQQKGLTLQIDVETSAEQVLQHARVYDLIFLDIDLVGSPIDGMDAAVLLRTFDKSTPIVFVTGLRQYALQGYEVNAIGFIVKPVTWPKLVLSMDKVEANLRGNSHKRIVLSSRGSVRVIPVSDVRYVEMQKHDLLYYLKNSKEPLKVRGSISALIEEIGEDALLRISSGCLVNADCVARLRGTERVLFDGTVLPVSRSRRKELVEQLAGTVGRRL